MDPKFWGPGLWRAIHSMAATAETYEDRINFKNMMTSMALVLPCNVCRKHLTENMKKNPIEKYMQSNESLFFWTYLLHDSVNAAQGKTDTKRPSFNQIFSTYFRNHQSNNDEIGYEFQDEICSEVCSEQQVTSNTGIKQTVTKSKEKMIYKSSFKPRFKSRKKYQ